MLCIVAFLKCSTGFEDDVASGKTAAIVAAFLFLLKTKTHRPIYFNLTGRPFCLHHKNATGKRWQRQVTP
jgi:hypothetical protein